MKITEQTRLNKGEQKQILELLKRCHDKEAFTLHFPLLEPHVKFFIARDDETNEIRSILALCRIGKTEYEVSAFTDPEYRKQGMFAKLWQKAQLGVPGRSLSGSSSTVRFALDSTCQDALPVLESIGAKLDKEETEMRCDLFDKEAEPSGDFVFRRSVKSGEGIIAYEALSKEDKRPVMRCFVMPMSDNRCYLNRVSVRKDLIGQGVGSRVFPELLAILNKQGFTTATMQVTASNIPAVKLYQANGFETTISLKYYVVDFAEKEN